MTRSMCRVCLALALVAAPAAAQVDGKRQPPSQPITVTGCVTPGTETVGTAGRSAPADTAELLLTETSVSPAPAEAPDSRRGQDESASVPPSRPSSPGTSAASRTTYVLLGSQVPELAKRTGQRVEVIGTPDLTVATRQQPAPTRPEPAVTEDGRRDGNPDGSVPDAGARGRTERPRSPDAGTSATGIRLIVSSFRPLAGTCR